MGFFPGLALLLLGFHLLAEGLAGLKGRRHLLAQALGGRALGAGVLLGALSGSGTGVSLLALGLLEGGVVGLGGAALLALGATAGAAFWVGLLLLPGGLGGVFLLLGLFPFLVPPLRRFGLFLLGLGLLFLGFSHMAQAVGEAGEVLRAFPLPLWGYYLSGFLLAFLLGSANAVAALALALGAALAPEGVLALTLGGGVGATGALFLAGLGGRKEAYRLGTVLLLHRLVLSLGLAPLLFLWPYGAVAFHGFSHLLYALLFLPLGRRYEALAEGLFPRPQVAPKYLSREALETPTLAYALAQREIARIADAVRGMLLLAVRILAQEEGGEGSLEELEAKVDRLTREVVLYTAELSARTGEERAVRFLVMASELEHLGDLVRRVVRQVEKLWAQGLTFSPEGKEELLEAASRVLGRLERMAAALATGEKALAEEVVRGREEMALFLDRLRRAHLQRLEGARPETRASTLAHLDLLITLDELDQGVVRLCELLLSG
jgi:phosphate:Na+ symporter